MPTLAVEVSFNINHKQYRMKTVRFNWCSLLCTLSLCTLSLSAYAYDSAAEGSSYWGDNCMVYGLSDGTVAISSYDLSSATQTEITFPSEIHATWNNADNAVCDLNFKVTGVGYSGWDFWATYWEDKTVNHITSSITKLTFPEGVTFINGNFYAEALTEVVLPSTLLSIDKDYALCGTALTSIVCNAANPPALAEGVFASSIITDLTCVVTVPQGAKENYNTNPWTQWTGFYEQDLIEEQQGTDPTPVVVPTNKLRGGDISRLTYIEANGAKFYDADGVLYNDVLDLLALKGVNAVRLRLYNNPGTGVTYTEGGANHSFTYRTPTTPTTGRPVGGYQGQQDILNLAARAANHNMKILLSFHLSDFWSDATKQILPATWANVTTNSVLCDSVYNYVYNFLQRMNAQGTTPDYVAIGNEINTGILFGFFDSKNNVGINTFGGHNGNAAQLKALLASGSAAVRAACPNAKIVIHLNNAYAGKVANYVSFLNKVSGLDFDVIGGSYYPYWTNAMPESMAEWASEMQNRYGKEVIVMECGYSWAQYRPAGRNGGNYEGQLSLNGTAYNEATKEGQVSFMADLQDKIDADDNILGYFYWDPIFVDFQVGNTWAPVCWAEKYDSDYNAWWEDGNSVSNTTWFDYTGKALPVLDEIASHAPSDATGVDNVSERLVVDNGSERLVVENASERSITENAAYKTLLEGNIVIVNGNGVYNPLGLKIK